MPIFLIEICEAGRIGQSEQSHFSVELDITPIEKPVALSDDIMGVLKQDAVLRKASKPCLKVGESIDQIRPSWFVASEVHLSSASETDFVVLSKNGCLLGANVGPFWIVRQAPNESKVILSIGGHDLDILRTQWKGYSEVRVASATAKMFSSTTYRFDGRTYRTYKSKSEPIH